MSRAVPLAALAALLAGLLAPAPASADDKTKDETPSEKVRKALDQPIDLDLKESSMAKAVERFREKTKLDISIDRSPFITMGVPTFDPNADSPVPFEGKFKGVKVRDALRRVFEPIGLTPFIIDDAVLLTSEDIGIQKQLKQRIDVDVSEVPLADALKDVGRRKAVNVVVDRRVKKQTETKVSLQVEDVALESAVRLLAEQAGLKAARIGNVLYVTTPDNAASIAAENRAPRPTYNPYGVYGFSGTFGAIGGPGVALLGAAGGGAIGFGGIGGLPAPGFAGAIGFGGMPAPGGFGGLAGFGGLMGFAGGVPPTVPPQAPPPPNKPSDPLPKPTQGAATPVAPTVAPGHPDPDRPLAPRHELWARPSSPSPAGARRSRRSASGG
jgi:hypothetical protein